MHSIIAAKGYYLFKLLNSKAVPTINKSSFECFCQYLTVKIKFIGKIINIVVIFHSAGEFHKAEDSVNLFGNGGFKGICSYRRSVKVGKLCRNFSLFLLRHNNITPKSILNGVLVFLI